MPREAARSEAQVDPVLEFIRLMWSVDHELQRVSKRMVARIGLTAPQRLAVRFIGIRPGLTPGALAGLLHIHPGTVTIVLLGAIGYAADRWLQTTPWMLMVGLAVGIAVGFCGVISASRTRRWPSRRTNRRASKSR